MFFFVGRQSQSGHFTGQLSTIDAKSELPVPLKIQWVLFNLQVGLNPLVCFGFWTLIVPFDKNLDRNLNVVSYHAHLINGLIVIVDLFLVAIPVHLAHIYMTY